MSKLARDNRNRDITLIHIAKTQLRMVEEDYRAMLLSVGGAASSKDLDADGRARVLDHLKACGFKPTSSGNTSSKRRPARPTPAPDKVKLVKRIRAQLISLGNKPDTYADSMAQHMFGVDFMEWCTPQQLHDLSAALGVHQRRIGASTA